MANMLQLIQNGKRYAKSPLLDETALTTEVDSALNKAFWAQAINDSQNYHANLVIQAAQDYFMTKTTVSFVSGTERYDLPGDSIKIRYVEKTDVDPDEVIKPISIDQRLDYTDQEDDTDNDDLLDHYAYLFNRSIGIVPNMNTGSVSLFYIRRLPDLLYGTCTATATTIVLPATPTFGTTSNEDDKYNNSRIRIVSATTGAGQIATISDYVGSTRTCTVPTWGVTPTGTIVADIVCEIPEEYHQAVSMYAAILGRAKDDKSIQQILVLHQAMEVQMKDGLQPRFSTKGSIVQYQDL